MTAGSGELPRGGEELPSLVVPVTRTLIVSGALASRDYQDVHHDVEAARAKGAPDIFMNILTTGGLVGRYITDWAGPGAELRRLSIRLGAPNYPGDTMTLTGRVTEITGVTGADGAGERGGEVLAEVAVVGRNGIGSHVTGTVTVALRREARGRAGPGDAGGSAGPGDTGGSAGPGGAGGSGGAEEEGR